MSVPSPSHYLFADAIFLLIFSGSDDPDMHLHDVYVYIYTNTQLDDSSSLLMSHAWFTNHNLPLL